MIFEAQSIVNTFTILKSRHAKTISDYFSNKEDKPSFQDLHNARRAFNIYAQAELQFLDNIFKNIN